MKKITFEDWQEWVWTLKKWQRTLRRRFASLPSLCPREPRTEWRIGSPRYGNIDRTNRAGLMRTQTELHVGQSMLLENPQNKAEQACRVVRVDDTADGDFAVAFEFATPHPKFWPVVFPPADWIAVPLSSKPVNLF